MQIDMGILAACFVERSGLKYCIVQLYEPLDSLGTQVLNEYDCPLYSNTFCCVSSSSILSSVPFFTSALLLVLSHTPILTLR